MMSGAQTSVPLFLGTAVCTSSGIWVKTLPSRVQVMVSGEE